MHNRTRSRYTTSRILKRASRLDEAPLNAEERDDLSALVESVGVAEPEFWIEVAEDYQLSPRQTLKLIRDVASGKVAMGAIEDEAEKRSEGDEEEEDEEEEGDDDEPRRKSRGDSGAGAATATRVFRMDLGALPQPIRTEEGFLRADVAVTRAGVFAYQNPDGTVRRELRHPNEVFAKASLDSLKMIPVTDDHPPEKLLDTQNASLRSIGFTGQAVSVDGALVVVPLQITDAKGILSVEGGRRELSCGYRADVVEEAGIFDGEEYTHRQRNIRYNHIAIVDRARGGPELKIHLDAADAVQIAGGTRGGSAPRGRADEARTGALSAMGEAWRRGA